MDKARLIYGHLALTDYSFGFISFDGKDFHLDEEAVKQHFAAIANAGANAVRILPYAVWEPRPYGRRSQFCPWVLDGNLWDLSKFNSYYFPIMRRIFEIINSYNMTVWFPLFDQCQQHKGYWTAYTPWFHNVQKTTSFYDTNVDKYSTYWVETAWSEFKGLDMFWPWGNELNGSKSSLAWGRRVIFPLIRKLNIPFDKMTYGWVMGDAPYLGGGKFGDAFTAQDTARKYFGEEFPPESNKFLLIREVHKCGTTPLDAFTPYGPHPAQAAFWWGNKPVGPFLISNDGTKENWPSQDGGRPDGKKWKAMAGWAFGFKNCAGVEHLPEGGDLVYQTAVMESISAAYKLKFGKWPENYGKWHYEPPVTPPPPPGPDPEPIPEPTPDPPATGLPGINKWVIIGGAIGLALAVLLLVLL